MPVGLTTFSGDLERLEPRDNPATFLAGEFNAIEFLPDGDLARLVWQDQELLWQREDRGGWQSESLTSDADTTSEPTQLLIASDGTAHVFKVQNQIHIDHFVRDPSGWRLHETLSPPGLTMTNEIIQLVAEPGPHQGVHLLYSIRDDYTSSAFLAYATWSVDQWQHREVSSLGMPDYFHAGARYTPRYLALAIDAGNHAHVTYTPEFAIHRTDPGPTVHSELWYASNRSGDWQSRRIHAPADGTGDSGLGSSIVVDASGTISIAHFMVDRHVTGSPVTSQLVLHTLTSSGSLSTEVVADAPAGYVAGDGPQFTGFAPDLQLGPDGKLWILFSDHASWHDPFANEVAGQVRIAVRDPNGWYLQTLLAQSDPQREQIRFPTLAISASRQAFAALEVIGDQATTRTATLRWTDELKRFTTHFFPGEEAPIGMPTAQFTQGDAVEALAVVAPGPGGPGEIRLVSGSGKISVLSVPVDLHSPGGLRVARGDVTGDGHADLVIATGPGVVAQILVVDGMDGSTWTRFPAFEPSFTGGLQLAVADFDGDGFGDLIIAADSGGGPRVRVVSGQDPRQSLVDFFGIADPQFRGGARVGAGDLDGDGVPELLVGAGIGGGPRIAVFDGTSIREGQPKRLVADFFVFEKRLRNGVYLTAGDLNLDGADDLMVGGGPGGAPRVLILDGQGLVASNGQDQRSIANYFAGDPDDRGGIRLVWTDFDRDGVGELVTGSGQGDGARVVIYAGIPTDKLALPLEFTADPFDDWTGGVFVG